MSKDVNNIAQTMDVNYNTTKNARVNVLRRTMLVKELNTGRCTTPQELQDRFDKLFQLAFREGFIPVVEHLALVAGWDRRTIWDIETGRSHKGDGMSDVIKAAKQMIAAMDAELACNNEMNSTIYKFRATNYYGMTEKQEMVVTPNAGITAPTNAQTIIDNIPELDD